jgi:hypothetical protein
MRKTLVALVASFALLAVACGDDGGNKAAPSGGDTSTTAAPTTTAEPVSADTIVFSGEGNNLNAYSADAPFQKQTVIRSKAGDPKNGLDINAQICFDPKNPRRFIAGEDTDQDTTGHAGWGIFELSGDKVGELKAKQIAKLVPTYQPANDNPENYGCGWLPDGRMFTTDVGNQASGPGDGQLIIWFPPFGFDENSYCKIDVELTTGQSMVVRESDILVAEARKPGVFRYPLDSLPTSPDAAGGCGKQDATGAPMITTLVKELFIQPDGDTNHLATPSGLAVGKDGHIFVASVFNGVISEFDADGTFLRVILEPPAGEQLGAKPYSTGTPLGIGLAADGSLFYADIGIVIGEGSVGPGNRTGTVRKIAFVDGEPQPPVVMDTGLAFPDGIGVFPPT